MVHTENKEQQDDGDDQAQEGFENVLIILPSSVCIFQILKPPFD